MSMKGQSSMTGMDIKPDAQGKVRDLYDLGDKLLLVATDRISAFDYILEDEIPHKGAVLTLSLIHICRPRFCASSVG